jgi:hypothetical protein
LTRRRILSVTPTLEALMNAKEMAERISVLEARLTRVVDALVVLLESIQAGNHDVAAADVIEMLEDADGPRFKIDYKAKPPAVEN